MKKKIKPLSLIRIKRIREQGYTCQSDREITDLAFGNRLAYQLCTVIIIIGVGLGSVPVLGLMTLVAFLSVLLPNHLFDYLYNHLISIKMKKPKLPPRSKQLKFACSIATIWLGCTTYMFFQQMLVPAYATGGLFICVAMLLVITDICIPSILFNKLFNKQ